MIGYVSPNLPYLYLKDLRLYNSAYCGLCKSIGATCGQVARFTLNYDVTFLSIVLHNLLGVDITVNEERCVTHWFKKRPIAKRDQLTDEIACVNVMIAYYNVQDDVIDQGKHKSVYKLLKKGYKKAVKRFPEYEAIFKRNLDEVHELENLKSDSIDMVSDSSAKLLRDIVRQLLKDKSTEYTDAFSYNLGKWVYLVDALDDYDKDKKNGNFNVFLNAYGTFENKMAFISAKKAELEFIFSSVIHGIIDGIENIKFNFNDDLIRNVINRGLIVRTREIMEGKQCKKPSMKY